MIASNASVSTTTMGFIHTPACAKLLEDSPALGALDPAQFDAVLICGGQGPMFTFRGNQALEATIGAFWDAARNRGANFIRAAAWQPFAIRDGQLISGQQQYSGAATARLLIEALGV